MVIDTFHSRQSLGTDQERSSWGPGRSLESSKELYDYTSTREVRVVLGRLGNRFRLSAHDIDVYVEGDTIEDVWKSFVNVVSLRSDAAWLTFDVGPTRANEIDLGLDADEDEAWDEPAGGEETD